MTASGVSGAVRDYCHKRGLTKTSAHLLRHTFAKNYITGGGDVLSLKMMLGHQSMKMVNRYANLYGSDIADKVEEHALINKAPNKRNRKKIKMREQKKE